MSQSRKQIITLKYQTFKQYNEFTSKTLEIKIKEMKLVDKSDISGFIDNPDLDKMIGNDRNITTKGQVKSRAR